MFIFIIFQNSREMNIKQWKFNTIAFVTNPILFRKYLGPLKSHRNGFVFKICEWILVFWRKKKRFENPTLGCRDIRQKPSLIFLGHRVLLRYYQIVVLLTVEYLSRNTFIVNRILKTDVSWLVTLQDQFIMFASDKGI